MGVDPLTFGLLGKIGELVVDRAAKQGWLDKLADVFRKKHKFLILGSSGTGKSNFIDSLRNLVPPTIHYLNRTQFPRKHAIRLSRQPFRFIDTPGQEVHEARRMREIRSALKSGVAGIINVVSYGYHEGPASKREVFNRHSVKKSFLIERRDVEKALLGEWKILLGTPDITKCLITLVNKADLWWDKSETVLKYYNRGIYYQALGSAKSLNPVVLPYCSVVHRFYDIGAGSGNFDDSNRVELRAHFLSELLAAIGR